MNLEDLVQQVTSTGLHPIRVESAPDDDDDLTFVGALPEYLQAVKAIGCAFLFIRTITLDDEHFLYQPEEDEDIEIDLCSILPKLSSFKRKVGIICYIKLFSPMLSRNLKYSVEEDWWQDFVALLAEANQIIDGQRTASFEQQRAVETQQKQRVLAKLQGLLGDKQFIGLRTQRAMREYARQLIPDIDVVDEQELTREIQALCARIEAQGLNRK